MRIGALLLGCVLLAWGQAASSDPLTIRSGDHPGFTRFVLEFVARPVWRAGRTDSGYAIALVGEGDLQVDLSSAFRFIGRDRVRDIWIDPVTRSLRLDLVCDCAAEVFELRDNAIVIDIRDGPAGPWANVEAPFKLLEGPAALAEIVGALAEPSSSTDTRTILPQPVAVAARVRRPEPMTPVASDSAPAARLERTEFRLEITDGFGPPYEAPVGPSPVAVEVLSRQLARAVAQGLVLPSDENHRRPAGTVTADTPSREAASNFTARTGLDRDLRLEIEGGDTDPGGAQCMSDAVVRVADWGDPDDRSELGRLRRDAVGEDGSLTQIGRRNLARHYIALGFGAEAAVTARLLEDDFDREILLAMADIVDNGATSRNVFEGQLACFGEVALWAALARPFSAAELPLSTDAILATFSALPSHLRENLGPVLSERLQKAGETEMARIALNSVTRVGHGSVWQDLTAARLGLTGTTAEASRASLERLSNGTDFTAAEALLELLEDARRRGVAPQSSWVDDADTLVRAMRGTEIAQQLTIAALWGMIPLERFDELRRALAGEVPGLAERVRAAMIVDALAASATYAEDEVFLRSEVGFGPQALTNDMPASVAATVAERLLDLGLPARALRYRPALLLDPATRTLAARISLENGQDSVALQQVAQIETADASRIRAAIGARSGALTEASVTYLEVGAAELAIQTALRSGDWTWIASSPLEPLAPAAKALLGPASISSQQIGDAYEGLLANIGSRRDALGVLLEASRPAIP